VFAWTSSLITQIVIRRAGIPLPAQTMRPSTDFCLIVDQNVMHVYNNNYTDMQHNIVTTVHEKNIYIKSIQVECYYKPHVVFGL